MWPSLLPACRIYPEARLLWMARNAQTYDKCLAEEHLSDVFSDSPSVCPDLPSREKREVPSARNVPATTDDATVVSAPL